MHPELQGCAGYGVRGQTALECCMCNTLCLGSPLMWCCIEQRKAINSVTATGSVLPGSHRSEAFAHAFSLEPSNEPSAVFAIAQIDLVLETVSVSESTTGTYMYL